MLYLPNNGVCVMSIEAAENAPKKLDKRSKTHHGSPRQPGVVYDIIRWRDAGDTWSDIGEKLAITRAGARHLYVRWHKWAQENPKP